jgi:alkaline phosphatase
MMKNNIRLIALFSLFASASHAQKIVKYIFLFIGEGSGSTAGGHTAAKVPVKVVGIGEGYFRTTIDNTEINDIILKVMQIPNKL